MAYRPGRPLLAAAKGGNAEVRTRAASILARIKTAVPEGLLEVRDEDVIYTKTGKVMGKIEGAGWKATTPLFGEVQVKLSDIRLLRSLANPQLEEDNLVVQDDPGTLSNLRGQVGKLFAFRVTGAVGGSVWGTDVYTSDSRLATAAVHAGVLEVGKTGTVKVRIIAPPSDVHRPDPQRCHHFRLRDLPRRLPDRQIAGDYRRRHPVG